MNIIHVDHPTCYYIKISCYKYLLGFTYVKFCSIIFGTMYTISITNDKDLSMINEVALDVSYLGNPTEQQMAR